jgi:hypothetical protein
VRLLEAFSRKMAAKWSHPSVGWSLSAIGFDISVGVLAHRIARPDPERRVK